MRLLLLLLLLRERGRKMETRSCLEMWVRLLDRQLQLIGVLTRPRLSSVHVQRGRIRIALDDVRVRRPGVVRIQILERKHWRLSSRTMLERYLGELLWMVVDCGYSVLRGWVRVVCVKM